MGNFVLRGSGLPVVSRSNVQRIIGDCIPDPGARQERLESQYSLSEYDASLLTAAKSTADFFEEAIASRSLEGDALGKSGVGHSDRKGAEFWASAGAVLARGQRHGWASREV